VSGDLHCVWLNSAALTRFGHAGHPTGLLREQPAFAITSAVAAVPDEELDRFAAEAAAVAAARGVVGIVDLEMTQNHAVWTRRFANGFDALRVEFGIYREHLDEARALGLHTGQQLGPLLTVGRLKVLTDGSLNTRTAYCVDPFENGSHGLLEVSPAELVAIMHLALDSGLELSVHAIGDAANTVALDAFESTGARGRIEHAQFVAASDFARFAELGITASVQPEHMLDDRDVADRYWAGRTDRAYAWKSLHDAGATLAFGSDAPVAALDPWVAMAAAVDRTRDDREPWHPEQRLTVDEAIAASTRSTIAVGQPADIVVVDRDPALGELREMPVYATYLAGRRTF
jgi:predicted amidohydrolase YtcJ